MVDITITIGATLVLHSYQTHMSIYLLDIRQFTWAKVYCFASAFVGYGEYDSAFHFSGRQEFMDY
jgi:hypothetical protein